VFQSEPFFRPEAGCGLPGISKPLKMLELRRPLFGNHPAFNSPAVETIVEGSGGPAHAVSTEDRERRNGGSR
jgi:hypothetical protein